MIHFQLVSASGTKFNEPAYEVLVPTQDGIIAVFKDHMPIISAGAPGIISVRKKVGDSDRNLEHFAISGGVLEVDGKTARFLTDDVTTPDEVSEQEAAAAYQRAQSLVKDAGSQVELNEARRLLHHATVKLQISKLKKRHHQ